jgi:hypothetical protein
MRILGVLVLFACALPAYGTTVCQVTEFASLARDVNGNLVPVADYGGAIVPVINDVSFASSTAGNAFAGTTRFIHVICIGGPAYYEIGAAPTATTSSRYIPANTERYLGVVGALKLAFVEP